MFFNWLVDTSIDFSNFLLLNVTITHGNNPVE